MCGTDKKAGRWEEEEEEEVDGKTSEIPPPLPVFPDGGSRQGEICESGGCRDGFFFTLRSPLWSTYTMKHAHIPYTLIQISNYFFAEQRERFLHFPPIKAIPSPETGAKEILIANGRFRGGGGRARMKHTSNFPSRDKRRIIDAAIELLMVPSYCSRLNNSFNRDGLPRKRGPFLLW